MRNNFFLINDPTFAILPHVWGKMIFMVGQVSDRKQQPLIG